MADKEFSIKIDGIEQTYKGIATVTDAGKKLDPVLDRLTKSTEKYTSYTQAMFGLFKAGTGLVTMFTGESEKSKKIMEDITKVLVVVNSLQEINNVIIKNAATLEAAKAVQTEAAAAATALSTTSTVSATIAQKAFNLVAKANPYLLIATAAIGLVSVLGSLISGT